MQCLYSTYEYNSEHACIGPAIGSTLNLLKSTRLLPPLLSLAHYKLLANSSLYTASVGVSSDSACMHGVSGIHWFTILAVVHSVIMNLSLVFVLVTSAAISVQCCK